jgi:hypothetical protein
METYFPDLMNSPSFYSILEPPPQANEPEALSQNPECVCCSHACLTTLLTCQVWKFLLASHPGDHEVSSKTSHVPVEHMFPPPISTNLQSLTAVLVPSTRILGELVMGFTVS